MSKEEILALLKNIRRFEHLGPDRFYDGWRSALDTVELDVKEFFAEKGDT